MSRKYLNIYIIKYILIIIIVLPEIYFFKLFNIATIMLFLSLIIFILFFDFIKFKKDKKTFQQTYDHENDEDLEAASLDNRYLEADKNNNTFNELVSKMKLVQGQLRAKSEELNIINQISEIISSITDVDQTIEYIYEIYKRFTRCDRCLISFIDEESEKLIIRYEFGQYIINETGFVVTKQSLLSKSFNSGKTILLRKAYILARKIYGDKIAIPLRILNKVVGVVFLEIGVVGGFDEVDLEFIENLSKYVSIAIKNAEMYNNIYKQKQEIEALYEETASINDELNNSVDELIKTKEELKFKNEKLIKYSEEMQDGHFQMVMALANSIEAMDAYTRGHCQRVMEISCEIAKRLGLSEEEMENLKYIAILHDIGKIGIPSEILNKKDKLTDEEMEVIRKHPIIAYTILRDVEFIQDGLPGILQHHEKFDGTGYPNGVKGKDICKIGRILCIADAFDAMTSDRPYRKAMSIQAAIDEIQRCKGKQFDPDISDVLIEMSKTIIDHI